MALDTQIDADWTQPFEGRQKLRFTSREVRDKSYGAWICLKFMGPNGEGASVAQNLFSPPRNDGDKQGNRITMGILTNLFESFGLEQKDFPEKTPAAIDSALLAYEGTFVDGNVVDDKPDRQGRVFKKVSKFFPAT